MTLPDALQPDQREDKRCQSRPRTTRTTVEAAPEILGSRGSPWRRICQARTAGNIVNAVQGRVSEPFRFDFTGNIVGLGGGTALVNLLGVKFHGRLGWWFYRMAYLQRLVGVKNKVALMLTLGLNALFDRDISCET